MKKSILIFTAAAALAAVACNKQEQVPVSEGKTIQLTLEATRGEADTKTAISYNDEYASLESVWTPGDKIYVYDMQSGTQAGILTQDGVIVNEKSSATAQYASSYATFKGSITVDENKEYLFVYQGKDNAKAVAESLLTFDLGTSADVAGLAKWDIATATGKVQVNAGTGYCAASFSNKLAFGYFSTEGINNALTAKNYYSQVTLDVRSGNVKGVEGDLTLPSNAKFYLPLVPGNVSIECNTVWSEQSGFLGKATIGQATAFTAAAGKYYRLGKNNTDSFGPVKFKSTGWTNYETLKESTFAVSATKNVHFTQGNLQWIGTNDADATEGYWKIADSQYSYLGAANAKGESNESGSKLNAGSVDLFGWGEVEAPFLCSSKNGDYQPSITTANVELPEEANWATKFNNGVALYTDKDADIAYPKVGGAYCVLSKAEWQYLFAHQYWGFAAVSVNGSTVNGLVICPSSIDTDEKASAILSTWYKSSANQTGKTAAFSENALTQNTIDENGLLFLPAAGFRSGAGAPSSVSTYGNYWSTTSSTETYAYDVRFATTLFHSVNSYDRYGGFSVRLATIAE